MLLVTPQQMREIDRNAIVEFGLPSILLMENAAIQALNVIKTVCHDFQKVLVIAGVGNNGGDGLALARLLITSGNDVTVVVVGSESEMTEDTALNYSILRKLEAEIKLISSGEAFQSIANNFESLVASADIIVDSLFGTGLNRTLLKVHSDLINFLNNRQCNKNKARVISLDIPSGINAQDGSILGSAVLADDTVAFGFAKMGHMLYPGRFYTGRLHVVPISLPLNSAQNANVKAFTLNGKEMAERLKKRAICGNKGTFGKAAVLAGSTGMTGAAALTSMAILKSGAGVVTLGIPASLNPILENKVTEVMTLPFIDNNKGYFTQESIPQIKDLLKGKDVLAFGPGIGRKAEVFSVFEHILSNSDLSIVLDADALYHAANNLKLLKIYPNHIVLTPHPGEMSALTGDSIDIIVENPVISAVNLSKSIGKIVLLKGAATVVASPDGRLYINSNGNSGMATAGSGDVLTGIIAALIAQKYDPFDAAVNGAYIHGLSGDEAASQFGEDALTATDILNCINCAIKKLRSSAIID